MNELNELIEQYQKVIDIEWAKSAYRLETKRNPDRLDTKTDEYWDELDKIANFVVWWQNKINSEFRKLTKEFLSRPTCGKEQRLFLDALEKFGTIHKGDEYHWDKILLSNGQIQEDFETEIMQNSEGIDKLDLQKVINGE